MNRVLIKVKSFSEYTGKPRQKNSTKVLDGQYYWAEWLGTPSVVVRKKNGDLIKILSRCQYDIVTEHKYQDRVKN